MSISKIDKNFSANNVNGGLLDVYDIPCAPFSLHGILHNGSRFIRMPQEVAQSISEGVSWLNTHTAGGRLRFSTNSHTLSISVTYHELWQMPHMPLTGSSGFVLIDNTDSEPRFAASFFPVCTDKHGFTATKNISSGNDIRSYTLYFPLYNDIINLKIGVDAGATVGCGKKYCDIAPIVYYGSSITQGGCASRPDTCYQAHIEKWTNIDFINLGFSGSARGERELAEYVATIPASVFVCDYDHNAPDVEHLRKTHYALYKTYRDKNPDTPIVFITKPDTDGDKRKDANSRFAIVRDTYQRAIHNNDQNVFLIDGRKLFGTTDRSCFTVDGCHPTDCGFYLMAKKIYKTLVKMR